MEKNKNKKKKRKRTQQSQGDSNQGACISVTRTLGGDKGELPDPAVLWIEKGSLRRIQSLSLVFLTLSSDVAKLELIRDQN